MNDALIEDEEAGIVNISREPVFVACVSGFELFRSNRKVETLVLGCSLRRVVQIEQPLPYRWVQILVELMAKHDVDEGLLTYASCTIPQTQRLFDAFPGGPMHITCSREVAESVRSLSRTQSTRLWTEHNSSRRSVHLMLQAIRWSAMIENSGQCTALVICDQR